MIVKLLRDAKIRHSAGEIVKVSPEEAFYLLSLGSAVAVEEPKAEPVKAETKEPTKKPKGNKK